MEEKEMTEEELTELHETLTSSIVMNKGTTTSNGSKKGKYVPSGRYYKMVTCYRCGQEGHMIAECRVRMKNPCSACGSLEHDEHPARRSSMGKRKRACFWCSDTDHYFVDCFRFRPGKNKIPGAICMVCGEKGHVSCRRKKCKWRKVSTRSPCPNCHELHRNRKKCREPTLDEIIPPLVYEGRWVPNNLNCDECGGDGHQAKQCNAYQESVGMYYTPKRLRRGDFRRNDYRKRRR